MNTALLLQRRTKTIEPALVTAAADLGILAL
jgi:hypothetical protein